jgi:hypothetical protein
VSGQVLQDVSCVSNGFPVMNAQLHQTYHRLQELINIVPLTSDNAFLDLEEVRNDNDSPLYPSSSKHSDEPSLVLLRNGGVGRFDEREAASFLDYLLQLLRDEQAAFSALGKDMVSTELKQLRQSINKLEQQLSQRHLLREPKPYLIVRKLQEKDVHHLSIRFWSTAGADANQIRPGTLLSLYKGEALMNNEVILITSTIGGRDKLNATESVKAYKSALFSRERLVTEEDIRAFCRYQVGEDVQQVNVQHGTTILPGERQGFSRTIDVSVVITNRLYQQLLQNGEIGTRTKQLEILLRERSVTLTPYRVFLNQEPKESYGSV